jgi:H+/gluconate symporter-like permease
MALSLIVLIIAVAIYVFLTYKGTSPIVAGLIAVAVLSLSAIGGFTENFFTVFTGGMASMVGGFFMIFTFGMLFGGVMEMTGAADRMGKTLFKKMGEKNTVWVLMIMTMVLAMTGPPHFALMPPLAFALMRHANLPRYIALAAVAGSGTAATVLPGCLTTVNVLTAEILGTDVYAGWQLGVIACVIQLFFVVLYVNKLMKNARKNLIGYDPRGNEPAMREEDDMPGFVVSIIPVILVLALAAIFILGLGLPSMWAMIAAVTIAMVFLLITCRKYIHGSALGALTYLKETAERVQPVIVCVLVVMGFASVVANTAVYQAAIPAIMAWNIHPAVLIVVGEIIVVALCADPIGGAAAFSGTIGQTLIAAGVNAGLVHRLTVITSFTFDTMPHGGAVTMAMRMFGYEIKEGYRHLLVVNLFIPCIYTIVCMFVAMAIY